MTADIPRCAVIIPTYNGAALTAACLDALLANPPTSCRWNLIVVDDGSTDATADELARFGSEIELIEQPVNVGFARSCNAGARAAADRDLLVFLNNDTIPIAGWLDELVEAVLGDDDVAAVGSKLLFPGGLVQHAGVAIGQDGWPHHLYSGFDGEHPAVNRPRDVQAVTAACLLIRRADFEALGGFDAEFHNGYEDVDLCLRLGAQGRRIRYCPTSVVYHLESVTRWPTGKPEQTEQSDRVYRERWAATARRDDIDHYLTDGLLGLSYGPHYPVTLEVSPELAVITRDGEDELTGLDRLVALRSRQVMDLITAETRRQLRSGTHSIAGAIPSRRSPAPPALIADGRIHQLGPAGSSHLVSVVIPVKDGAAYLRELLPAVLGQSLAARLEIIGIDSASTDDSVEVLKEHGATVLGIESSDFDHGLTRNLAAEHANGDVLVLLTQRCLPVGSRWLEPLIAALDSDPSLAGACSRVTPRPDADPLTRRDVERDLSGSTNRARKQIEDWAAWQRMSAEEQRVLLNFHTVSAAIRMEAWRRIPFRSVPTLGEDLLWAREVLEAGWALLHEPASVVQHSHAYTLEALLARNVDDGIANHQILGRTLAAEDVEPMIRAMIADDWSFLRETLKLSGEELESLQLESALRRAAQVVGQWIGLGHESLPRGMAMHFSGVAQSRAAAPNDGG